MDSSKQTHRLRAAVVGAGRMGENHARFYATQADTELVAVVDSDAERAREVAWRYRASPGTDLDAAIGVGIDLATVSAPTAHHVSLAKELISRGVHVLIEKPLAVSAAEAREIQSAASRSDRVVAVGHIERFNPAVTELKARLGQVGRIVSIHFTRISPYPGRIRDTGVALDLATHDLDLARFILGEEPLSVHAVAQSVVNDGRGIDDALVASLTFPSGAVCTFDVNWVSPAKVRAVRVLGELGSFDVDLMRQQLEFYEGRIVPSRWREFAELSVGTGEGVMTRYAIEHQEPLALELRAFLGAIAGRGTVPTAEDGARAVMLAELALRSSKERRVETLAQERRAAST